MKYVIFTLQEMTPEQLKQNPITVHPNQQLDTDDGESNKGEEESFTSTEMSEQNSTSDIPPENTEEAKPTETSQVLTVLNKTILLHHEDDSSEDKSVAEIEPYTKNGEQILEKRTDSLPPTLKLKLKIKKWKG